MFFTLIICILSFTLLVPFWDFALVIENYLSLIPFIIYTTVIILYRKYIDKKNETANPSIEISCADIYKAFLFNFITLMIFLLIFFFFIKVSMGFLSKNVLLLIYYVLFTQNTIVRSPGFIACNIYIENNTFKTSLFLLVNNLYKYSLLYFALFPKDFRESEVGITVISILLIFYLLNIFYRFCISRKYSLVESLLKILYVKKNRIKLQQSLL